MTVVGAHSAIANPGQQVPDNLDGCPLQIQCTTHLATNKQFFFCEKSEHLPDDRFSATEVQFVWNVEATTVEERGTC